MLYLDYAATAPLLPSVKDIYIRSLDEDFANPHASHSLGRRLSTEVDLIRKEILQDLKLSGQVIFTGSATESNNLVLSQFAQKKVVTSLVYHPSLLNRVRDEISKLSVNDIGQIDIEKSEELICQAELISLQWVNNQFGTIENINEVCEFIRSKNSECWIHIDAVQVLGKTPFNLKDDNFDSLSLSGHKIGAPKGIGCLILKEKHLEKMNPLFYGGNQEFGLRSSTLSTPLVKAFGQALKLSASLTEEYFQSARENRQKIIQILKNVFKEKAGFPFEERSCSNIVGFFIKGLSSDVFMRCMEERNVYLSSSSACSSKNKKENLALKELGYDLKMQKSFIRLSFGQNLAEEELELLEESLEKAWEDIEFLIS
ncbi:MAG: aminotransferase class V-fold PLP-dependent enzyme [Oligoflexia bacterium]|nr:aminotransferase class V-fold PLP-dependent enzyme [Oligoflexia bacterium]